MRTNEDEHSMKPQERGARNTPHLHADVVARLFTPLTLWKVLVLGIFRRGVVVGALVFMMLNRLQMLKESRGQECKRPDRESERERKQETLLAPEDPTGDLTNHRVTSVSFFQHKVIPLLPPLPSQQLRYMSKPFLASILLCLINIISAKFTISVANSVLICSFILCFIPFLHPSLCLWPLLSILMLLHSDVSVCGIQRNIFTGNINANEFRIRLILAQRADLFSWQPYVADEEECAVSINHLLKHTHTHKCSGISAASISKLVT